MVLKNYYEYLKVMGDNETYLSYPDTTNIKRMSDGNSVSSRTYDYDCISTSYANAYNTFWVGSGNTAPASTDYDLDVDETSNFTDKTIYYRWTSCLVDGEARGTLVITFIGKNNTSNPITLREVGVSKHFTNDQQGSTPKWSKEFGVLILRELLQTPITVQPQQVVSLSLSWIF